LTKRKKETKEAKYNQNKNKNKTKCKQDIGWKSKIKNRIYCTFRLYTLIIYIFFVL